MYRFLRSVVSLILIFSISRVEMVVAAVKHTPKSVSTYKVLNNNILATSGQLYKIVHPSILKDEILTLDISGGTFHRAVTIFPTSDGSVKFGIPFILDESSENPSLKNLKVTIKLLEKNLIFSNVSIRKPVLVEGKDDTLNRTLDSLLSKANEARGVAQQANRNDLAEQIQKIIEMLEDMKNEYFSTSQITYTDSSGSQVLQKKHVDVMKVMLAGSIMGVLNEGQPEQQTPVIKIEDLKPFFDNISGYDIESVFAAITSFNSTNDVANSVTLAQVAGFIITVLGGIIIAVAAITFILYLSGNLSASTNSTLNKIGDFKVACRVETSCHSWTQTLTDTIRILTDGVTENRCDGAAGISPQINVFVATGAYLSPSVIIPLMNPFLVEICQGAQVYGNATISGKVRITGSAQVHGNANLNGFASGLEVKGTADVMGRLEAYGNLLIMGTTKINEGAYVYGSGTLDGSTEIGSSEVSLDETQVTDSQIFDSKVYLGSYVTLSTIRNSTIKASFVGSSIIEFSTLEASTVDSSTIKNSTVNTGSVFMSTITANSLIISSLIDTSTVANSSITGDSFIFESTLNNSSCSGANIFNNSGEGCSPRGLSLH